MVNLLNQILIGAVINFKVSFTVKVQVLNFKYPSNKTILFFLYCQCHCANAQACEVKVYSQLARQFELMTLGAPAGRECGVRCVFKSKFSLKSGPHLMGPPPMRPFKRLKVT